MNNNVIYLIFFISLSCQSRVQNNSEFEVDNIPETNFDTTIINIQNISINELKYLFSNDDFTSSTTGYWIKNGNDSNYFSNDYDRFLIRKESKRYIVLIKKEGYYYCYYKTSKSTIFDSFRVRDSLSAFYYNNDLFIETHSFDIEAKTQRILFEENKINFL